MRRRVKWANTISDSFVGTNGVKQVGVYVLSPIWFCIYTDQLTTRLYTVIIGCYFNNTFFGALCHTDNVTLLSPSRNDMSQLLNLYKIFTKI